MALICVGLQCLHLGLGVLQMSKTLDLNQVFIRPVHFWPNVRRACLVRDVVLLMPHSISALVKILSVRQGFSRALLRCLFVQ